MYVFLYYIKRTAFNRLVLAHHNRHVHAWLHTRVWLMRLRLQFLLLLLLLLMWDGSAERSAGEKRRRR